MINLRAQIEHIAQLHILGYVCMSELASWPEGSLRLTMYVTNPRTNENTALVRGPDRKAGNLLCICIGDMR